MKDNNYEQKNYQSVNSSSFYLFANIPLMMFLFIFVKSFEIDSHRFTQRWKEKKTKTQIKTNL